MPTKAAERSAALFIVTRSVEIKRNSVVVCIANQGPPLPPSMADRLFDSLVSVHPSAAQKIMIVNGVPLEPPHLGLGLSIVRLIVELHRGKAHASNLADGPGVEFSLELHGMLQRPLIGAGVA